MKGVGVGGKTKRLGEGDGGNVSYAELAHRSTYVRTCFSEL